MTPSASGGPHRRGPKKVDTNGKALTHFITEMEDSGIPVDHLDYGYIEKCSDRKELNAILKALESGKEGRWPDLERACEQRLVECMSAKERRLFMAQRTEPSMDEVSCARSEIEEFVNRVKINDQSLKLPLGNRSNVPAVRGSSTVVKTSYSTSTEEEQKKETKSISGYDFRAWEKFDVESELENMDKEELEVLRKQNEIVDQKQKIIDERKERTKKTTSVHSNNLTNEQSVFFSTKEKEKGNECFKAGEFDDAARFYSKSIDFLPENSKDAKPFANRAMAFLKLERFEEAEKDCTTAIELDPVFIKCYARRGMARHRRGKYLDAISDFEYALHLEPNNSSFSSLLAASRKKYNQVGGIGSERHDAPPRSGFKKLMIIEDSDSEEDAEEDPEECVTWMESKASGTVSFQNKDFETALSHFSKAVDLLRSMDSLSSTDLCNCMGNQAVCYKELKMFVQVVTVCSDILELSPDHVKSLFRRAIALEKLGRLEDALNDMCQVLRLDPEQNEAGEKISQLMQKLQNPVASFKSLKEQGNALFKECKFQQAIESYSECLNLEPDALPVLSNRAMTWLKLETFQPCIDDCTRALALSQATPSQKAKLLFRRSMGYKGLGLIDTAIKDLQNLLTVEPLNSIAKQELAALEKQSCVQKAIKVATSSNKQFTVPKSLYEFQKTWKMFGTLEKRKEYCEIIPSDLFSTIFKVEIPEDLLMEIINVLDRFEDLETAGAVLRNIASISRFGTTMKFLGQNDLQTLQTVAKKLNVKL